MSDCVLNTPMFFSVKIRSLKVDLPKLKLSVGNIVVRLVF